MSMSNEVQENWPKVQQLLRGEVGEADYNNFLKHLRLDTMVNSSGPNGGMYTARVSAPSKFLRTWVQRHYADLMLACYQAVDPSVYAVEISLRNCVLSSKLKRPPDPEITTARPTPVRMPVISLIGAQQASVDSPVEQHANNAAPPGNPGAGRNNLDVYGPFRPQAKQVKIEEIQRVVAMHYEVSRADLLSSWRVAFVVRPRQVAMYLAKMLTSRSFPEIGRRFGGRDHTTVLHAFHKIRWLIGDREHSPPHGMRNPYKVPVDIELAEEIKALKWRLQA